MPATPPYRAGRPWRLLVASLEVPRPDQNGGTLPLRTPPDHGRAARRRLLPVPRPLEHPEGGAIRRLAPRGRRASPARRLGRRPGEGPAPAGLRRRLLRVLDERRAWRRARPADPALGEGRRRLGRHPLPPRGSRPVRRGLRRPRWSGTRAGSWPPIGRPTRSSASPRRRAGSSRPRGGVSRRGVIPVVVPCRERPGRDRRPELLFLGGFQHAPNLDGLSWFVREAWPAVRVAVPGARLTVVGSNPTPEVERLGGRDGIEVVGRVPETGPYLERAALMVAPLRYGAGMKTKVVEAMAAGLAVVHDVGGGPGPRRRPGGAPDDRRLARRIRRRGRRAARRPGRGRPDRPARALPRRAALLPRRDRPPAGGDARRDRRSGRAPPPAAGMDGQGRRISRRAGPGPARPGVSESPSGRSGSGWGDAVVAQSATSSDPRD